MSGLLFTNANKTLFEIAIERNVQNVIRRNGEYRASHINEICTKNVPHLLDNYSSRAQGYYSVQESYKLINAANTVIAKKIKAYIAKMYDDGDYIVVKMRIVIDPVEDLENPVENPVEDSVENPEDPEDLENPDADFTAVAVANSSYCVMS